jgi:hypothetical protein
MTIQELVYETISEVQHQIWSDWMKYLFSICEHHQDGRYTIPTVLARRWQQQILTPYSALSEQAKDSDREQTEKILKAFTTDVGENLRSRKPGPEASTMDSTGVPMNFEVELATLLSRFSKESDSDTPDVILAGFLNKVLEMYNETVADRERWHRDEAPELY